MGKLGVGVSGPAVKTVQQKLNEAYKGSVVAETGEFDENTAGAVARFQATASLPQSGAVDDATLKALFWAAKEPGYGRAGCCVPKQFPRCGVRSFRLASAGMRDVCRRRRLYPNGRGK